MLKVPARDPDLDHVTTAPVLGQPAAAYPAAPRKGRAGLLAVPVPVIAVCAVLGAVLALLRDMGHRYLQGHVFSRPLEAEQLADGAWETCVELPGTVSSTNADVPAQSPAMPS
jgi:hypothetical protein